jgi:hypothetical protein
MEKNPKNNDLQNTTQKTNDQANLKKKTITLKKKSLEMRFVFKIILNLQKIQNKHWEYLFS